MDPGTGRLGRAVRQSDAVGSSSIWMPRWVFFGPSIRRPRCRARTARLLDLLVEGPGRSCRRHGEPDLPDPWTRPDRSLVAQVAVRLPPAVGRGCVGILGLGAGPTVRKELGRLRAKEHGWSCNARDRSDGLSWAVVAKRARVNVLGCSPVYERRCRVPKGFWRRCSVGRVGRRCRGCARKEEPGTGQVAA